MAEQPGVMGPDSFPIRDPRSPSMNNGRMMNPPRFPEIGGFDSASKWYGKQNQHAQISDRHALTLESGGPTGVRAAKRTSESQKGV